ncbi:MAG: riboflavin synthase [Flavobacteriales bacterium]|nr:riboflavin synthase [Flavobacteriales bacterium]MEB2341032.1 riboflavin synthase [Flavobacteriia bacterium]
MFTGIVEQVGEVVAVESSGANRDLVIRAPMAPELRVDQSVSHNGVCLTVVGVAPSAGLPPGCYRVTAVQESLGRSNIGKLGPGDGVNLERSLQPGDRLDGHLVQGHVDTMVPCTGVEERDGSWWFTFGMPEQGELLVEKGSVCLNGVSLTIAALKADAFSVAVIPYTYGHTTFRSLRPGDAVNVEYDVLGKYVARMLAARVTP